MADLRLSGLTKALGGRTVVNGVDLAVAEGELMVILGPSGCGKTTTLRMVCGLEQPDAGTVAVGGRDVTFLPPRERNFGMVFQEYGLYPSMDVFGNLAYGLQVRHTAGKAEIAALVQQTAGKLGLTEKLRRPIGELSGGEQQRVALGRAMVKDADAYLFDEPLSNLDPKLRHSARRDILALHRAKGRPSIYITHDQSEAIALADRIAIMANGEVQQVGTAEELAHAPANVFVAGFLGSPPMNLLTGLIKNGDRGLEVLIGSSRLALGPELLGGLSGHRSDEVVVGLRPDALTLARGARPDLSGVVTGIEPLIGETVVYVRLDSGDTTVAVLREYDAYGVQPGVHLGLATTGAGGLCLFDPYTGKALAR